MPLFKTRGVVLRRRDLGEADRLLTLLTRRFGKLKAVAKGSRRARSRFTGHLEPLNEAEFMLWRREGRDLAIVSGATLVEHHPALAAHLPSFAAASFAAELLDRSLEEDEPQPRLYDLLHRLLLSLRRPEHAAPALLAFTVRA
ncbi:MAG: DNA repair protein RecO, partial [bacterium]